MTIVVLLLALLTERFLLDQYEWRQAGWFERYFNMLISHQYGTWIPSRYWGALVVLAPLLLIVGIIQGIICGVAGGVLTFLFAVAVLLYCLGPDDLDTQTADFINAQEQGDEDKAKQLTHALCQCEPAESAADRMRQVREAIFVQSNQRIFAVILWFLILGPMGAVLYRYARHLMPLQRTDDESQTFNQGIQRLIFILDWLPARIVAFTFALAGNFENTLYRWRNWSAESSDGAPGEAGDLLVNVGDGALMIEKEENDAEADTTTGIEAALSLIWRTLVVWLVLIGLIDLAL